MLPDNARLGDVLPPDTFPAESRSPVQVPVMHLPTLRVLDISVDAKPEPYATNKPVFEVYTFERVQDGWQRVG